MMTMGTLITVLIDLLEGMFVIGWLGSIFVLLITGVEDMETLVRTDDATEH